MPNGKGLHKRHKTHHDKKEICAEQAVSCFHFGMHLSSYYGPEHLIRPDDVEHVKYILIPDDYNQVVNFLLNSWRLLREMLSIMYQEAMKRWNIISTGKNMFGLCCLYRILSIHGTI